MAAVPALVINGTEPPLPVKICRFERVVVDPAISHNGHKPKVIADFAREGIFGIAAATAGEGMNVYRPPGWTKVLINSYHRDGGEEDAQAVDINGDGAPDIVIGGLDNEVVWLENPLPSGKDPYQSPWTLHTIGTAPSHDVVVADMDGDGKTDVIANGGVLFQNGPDSWMLVGRPLIDRNAEGTMVGNIVGDSVPDIIAPDARHRLVWFENPRHGRGDPRTQAWTPHVIAVGFERMAIAVADLNHDGRLDVMMAPMYHEGGLVWLENPPDPRHGNWVRHEIDSSINFVHQGSLQVADFNGDGNLDIAFAEQEQSPTRRVGVFYSNDREGHAWTLQVLARTGGHNIKVGRIGRDTRPSILNANHGFFGVPNPLEVWHNLGPAMKEIQRR